MMTSFHSATRRYKETVSCCSARTVPVCPFAKCDIIVGRTLLRPGEGVNWNPVGVAIPAQHRSLGLGSRRRPCPPAILRWGGTTSVRYPGCLGIPAGVRVRTQLKAGCGLWCVVLLGQQREPVKSFWPRRGRITHFHGPPGSRDHCACGARRTHGGPPDRAWLQ